MIECATENVFGKIALQTYNLLDICGTGYQLIVLDRGQLGVGPCQL